MLPRPPAAEDPGNGQPPDATSSETRSLSTVSDATTYVNLSVDTQSAETAVSDAPPDVPEDPSDPDMLVLGFQELDLSTEALLYSTKTAREQAWCMAAFAGLGEKAVLYEKVGADPAIPSSYSGGSTDHATNPAWMSLFNPHCTAIACEQTTCRHAAGYYCQEASPAQF